ncbi:MAG: diacylglycerol kinase [Cyanobacteria bacterium QS_8_64_29]|nr:MAG: diacylglycerol kinase [Cyanobacteria bacterium QS_8_64_29]
MGSDSGVEQVPQRAARTQSAERAAAAVPRLATAHAQTTQWERERRSSWQIATSLGGSFQYAWLGLRYTFRTQRNFRIHTAIGTLALGLGWGLQVPRAELAVIGVMVALVLALELLNTAIESVVDLTVECSYHELAKMAKDCAAGAVLVSSVAAVVVAGLVLLPPLLAIAA